MENTICSVEENNCKYETIGCNKISQALSIISGKWKLKLLYIIGYYETIRYGEIKRQATPITHKMLSTQLKELESDGLIIRKEYPQIPPKVEYSLSEKGYGLLPMFDELYNWIIKFNL
jgi:DNA-binding HxlR family transcriptional regulator